MTPLILKPTTSSAQAASQNSQPQASAVAQNQPSIYFTQHSSSSSSSSSQAPVYFGVPGGIQVEGLPNPSAFVQIEGNSHSKEGAPAQEQKSPAQDVREQTAVAHNVVSKPDFSLNQVIEKNSLIQFKKAFSADIASWSLSGEQAKHLHATFHALTAMVYKNLFYANFKQELCEISHTLFSALIILEQQVTIEVEPQIKERIQEFCNDTVAYFFAANIFKSHITSETPILNMLKSPYNGGTTSSIDDALKTFKNAQANNAPLSSFSLSYKKSGPLWEVLKDYCVAINFNKEGLSLLEINTFLKANDVQKLNHKFSLSYETKKIIMQLNLMPLSKEQATFLKRYLEEKIQQKSGKIETTNSHSEDVRTLYFGLVYLAKREGVKNPYSDELQQFVRNFVLLFEFAAHAQSAFKIKDILNVLGEKKSQRHLNISQQHACGLQLNECLIKDFFDLQQQEYEAIKFNPSAEASASSSTLKKVIHYSMEKLEFVELTTPNYIHIGSVKAGSVEYSGMGRRVYLKDAKKIIIGEFKGNETPAVGEIHYLNPDGEVTRVYQGKLKNGEPTQGTLTYVESKITYCGPFVDGLPLRVIPKNAPIILNGYNFYGEIDDNGNVLTGKVKIDGRLFKLRREGQHYLANFDDRCNGYGLNFIVILDKNFNLIKYDSLTYVKDLSSIIFVRSKAYSKTEQQLNVATRKTGDKLTLKAEFKDNYGRNVTTFSIEFKTADSNVKQNS